ncbi:MAG: Penicillin-binding protein [Candidatus Giovannonibacteria bacterium GW2011_GWB1_47_6b]|uniref:Penicillin-binding protein n=1 Tax=Candidatus Giovannonibacteria bacterium GW2011_GWB1_47_6b TaxID=1618655 RepID=A0A0G1VDJ7_9BACT|nr:MAG: Penicillin-binding protein [Candidatus Giovannonibacteria bacterium GW2011_GWB1_47_6b]
MGFKGSFEGSDLKKTRPFPFGKKPWARISAENFEKTISDGSKTNSVFFVAADLNKEQILAVENGIFKGFHIIPDLKRRYVDGKQFAHIIGYVGKVNGNDLRRDAYYESVDFMGRTGIEAEYEKILRGEHGRLLFDGGVENGKIVNRETSAGSNLVLNIDYALQKKLYNETYNILAANGLAKAAAIIQNPQNGAVLALVSFPDYDNNDFAAGLSDREADSILKNKNQPLFNRVIGGLYNPGSTIKPLMGLMALEEKIFAPQDNIRDCVSLTVPNPFDADSPYVFKNWRSESGLFNLRKAIANSCNIYFFIAGGGHKSIKGLGVERITKYLTASLAAQQLGIDLPGEEAGFIPGPDWKLAEKRESWYLGDTYNISIGQGDLLISPLWLNSYISAIGNGGTFYKPQTAQRILDANKNTIQIFQPEKIGQLQFKQDNILEIKSDMEETVLSGTAKALRDLPVRAGAKTGTAEVVKNKKINSLFSAFAPWENPEIAITVLVEDAASNQGLAVQIAHNVLKWYFGQFLPQPVESSPVSESH